MFIAHLKRPLVAINDMFRKMPRMMTFYDPIGVNAAKWPFFRRAAIAECVRALRVKSALEKGQTAKYPRQ